MVFNTVDARAKELGGSATMLTELENAIQALTILRRPVALSATLLWERRMNTFNPGHIGTQQEEGCCGTLRGNQCSIMSGCFPDHTHRQRQGDQSVSNILLIQGSCQILPLVP